MVEQQRDVIEILEQDHREVEEMFAELERLRGASTEEAKHAREEHAEAEKTLQRLEKLDAGDPAFDDELATLMAEIRLALRPFARPCHQPRHRRLSR